MANNYPIVYTAITTLMISACSALNNPVNPYSQTKMEYFTATPNQPAVLRKGLYITDKTLTKTCSINVNKPTAAEKVNGAKITDETLEPSVESNVLANSETQDRTLLFLKEVVVPIAVAAIGK